MTAWRRRSGGLAFVRHTNPARFRHTFWEILGLLDGLRDEFLELSSGSASESERQMAGPTRDIFTDCDNA
jgi:hypothetical protein